MLKEISSCVLRLFLREARASTGVSLNALVGCRFSRRAKLLSLDPLLHSHRDPWPRMAS